MLPINKNILLYDPKHPAKYKKITMIYCTQILRAHSCSKNHLKIVVYGGKNTVHSLVLLLTVTYLLQSGIVPYSVLYFYYLGNF